jgi:FixJ family two-component response regulator
MRENLSTLAPQERRVLRLVAEGKTNKEIGAALHLTEKTVKNYVSRTFENCRCRVGLRPPRASCETGSGSRRARLPMTRALPGGPRRVRVSA